ncbi:hypothetical protein ACYSNR_02365 [Enterococcus sp. LJL128]
MDFLLDILIPESELYGVELQELLLAWGEETFSQDPREYRFGRSLHFKEVKGFDRYFQKTFQQSYDEEVYLALHLQSSHLQELQFRICKNGAMDYSNELIQFVQKLYQHVPNFFLLLELCDELSDGPYDTENAEEAIYLLNESLSLVSGKGVIITRNKKISYNWLKNFRKVKS